MASDVANEARSAIDPGGTLEVPAMVAAVAPTLASQDAPPQERGVGVDASLSTVSPSSPQVSTGGGNVAVSTAVETSSSGMRAVDVIPAPPRLSSASGLVPSPHSSLVGGATVPAVVKTNSNGDNAPLSHNSSNSGFVDVHGTTSLRGASGVRISGRPQDSGASKRVAAAAGEARSSNTYAASPAFAPLGLSSADNPTSPQGSATVDDSVIPAAVNASSDGPGAPDPVDEDVRAPTLSDSSSLRPPPSQPCTSRASIDNHTISGPVVEGSSVLHGAAECAATSQLQEVAELLKHAGNLLSRIGISNAQHVHVPPNDNKCTTCSCACPQNPQPHPSVSEDARAVSAAAANTAPAEATCSKGGMLNNQGEDVQDPRSLGPPQKGPQEIQQPSSAAQQVPPGQQTPPGQLTGWAAVEKALKEFDQQEIGGYKEDIDSLLTFTGLYSAVLTAFVIVSYPLLQDPNQASASMSMSTPSTPSTPFQPSITAIRINVLWFASLVISLATASSAILVKQWLRSYLKFASASPQGQLRIRHFRRAGLETWKVFGIASTLPLLLQVSLALFFAGLCLFTQDVYPAVGHITLPLVCAWLFFFVVVTISPSFTAQCPYTTPALAGITYTLRTQVYPALSLAIIVHIPYGIAKALYWVFGFITKYASATPFQQVYQFFRHAVEHPLQLQLKLVEESDMIKDAQLDLDILALADALQADDRLLGTTIKSALEQSDTNWVQLVQFAVQIIGNRIPIVHDETNLKHIVGVYKSLSLDVRKVIDEIFQSHVVLKATEVDDDSVIFPKDWQTIARWALCIIIQVNGPQDLFLPFNTAPEKNQRWQAKALNLAFKLHRMASIELDDTQDVMEERFLQLVNLHLLKFHKDNVNMEKRLVMQCLTLSFTSICQVLAAVYQNDTHQLSNIIHSILDLDSRDFRSLKAIEVMKLSLLSVRVVYGKIHDNQDSKPNWSPNEVAQWKRTFIWLANRLWILHPFIDLSPDELAALQQLATSGWEEIPDPTEDSSQQALPLPDYFYLMLLYTTRQDLSQIPRQHPQLLRVAHMSKNERNYIENKGIDMARAYRRNLGNLYPPGVEDNDGGGLLCTGTSAPPQDSQDPVLNGSGVDQEELSVSGGLQRELPTDTYDVSPSRSRSPSDSEVRITEATNQFLQTSPGQANNSQPGQSPPPMYEKTYMSEDKDPSQGEELDDSPKELTLAGDPAKLAKDPGHLAGAAVHQASKEGRATPGVSEGHTMPVSLPTSARNETVPAEVQDSLEVTANNTQAYPVSDRVASLLGDGAVVEDDSQHADNITTVAESAHTILRSSSARDEGYAHADVEAGTGDEEQMAKREVRAVD